MVQNSIAENVLGTIGTVLWSFQLVPQIIKSYRSKDTEGLSSWLLLIWVAGSIPQGTYLVVQNINIPLIIQPQLFSFFAIVAMTQCWHYSHKISTRTCLLGGILSGLVAGGFEVAFYFLCKLGEDRGTSAGTKTMGITGAVLIVAGLVPQYYEIWKCKQVKGISLLFLFIDSMGGVFSLLSLVFKAQFDGIAAANYIGIVVLEFGIFVLYFTLNPRARKREAQLQDQEQQQLTPQTEEQAHTQVLSSPPTQDTTPSSTTPAIDPEKGIQP